MEKRRLPARLGSLKTGNDLRWVLVGRKDWIEYAHDNAILYDQRNTSQQAHRRNGE